ncbi:MAG: hypothetical protein V8S87_05630 [Oscillospiraceae bacterium]
MNNSHMACSMERHPSDAPELPQGLFRCADTPISVDRLRRRSAAKRSGGEALVALEELAGCIPSSSAWSGAIGKQTADAGFNTFKLASPQEDEGEAEAS